MIRGNFGAMTRAQLREDALSLTREAQDRWRNLWRLRVEDGIDWPIADVLRDGGRVDLISDGSILGIRHQTLSKRVWESSATIQQGRLVDVGISVCCVGEMALGFKVR